MKLVQLTTTFAYVFVHFRWKCLVNQRAAFILVGTEFEDIFFFGLVCRDDKMSKMTEIA